MTLNCEIQIMAHLREQLGKFPHSRIILLRIFVVIVFSDNFYCHSQRPLEKAEMYKQPF